MVTRSKVEYNYSKQKGFKTLEVADPTNRLKKGEKLTKGIEFYLSTDGTTGKLKVRPEAQKQEPLPHTYDGEQTAQYVAPKRDGGITWNVYVSIDKYEAAGEEVVQSEAREAVREIFRLIELKRAGKFQELIDELSSKADESPEAA